jgi:Methylase involved in ubiquinone/menaquinone biosynthesis
MSQQVTFEKNDGLTQTAKKDDVYYWQLWHHNWDDHDIVLFRKYLSFDKMQVLEVGCGDGRVTFSLARECGEILGVDIDKRLIESAQTRLTKIGLENTRFAAMDAQALDIPSGSVDTVLYPWVLHMVDDRKSTMEEAYRILKPAGTAAVIGIHTEGDYYRIIAPFVSELPATEPGSFYELPIRESFGAQVTIVGKEMFPYIFATVDIAYEAFIYTLGFHYGAFLSEEQKHALYEGLLDYEDNCRVQINFVATLYLAVK